jgi:uncharacterized protein YoaH (UPF0181 family)
MNETISLRILVLMHQGMSIKEAIDAVLGAGTYEVIAGEIYEKLRAQ